MLEDTIIIVEKAFRSEVGQTPKVYQYKQEERHLTPMRV